MSLSPSPIGTQRAWSPNRAVDCSRFWGPANAFTSSIATRAGTDLLQSVRALECLSGPERDRCESQRQALRGHYKARTHEDAARRVVPWNPISVGTGNTDARPTERLGIVPLIAEFRGVMEHEDRSVRCRCAISSRLETTCQNISLTDPALIEETVSSFRVRPVLRSAECCPQDGGTTAQEQPEIPFPVSHRRRP